MKQTYKKLSAWMILVGLFLQISTPVVAALQSSHSMSSNTVISGKSGVSVKNHLSELQDSESVDVANFNIHGLIEQIVEDAVEQGYENNLSSALMRCYKSVSEGETVLDADMLIEAMPELLQYAVEQEKMRASRPDANPSLANNAIAACGGDCDLTQLIRLLASIRARIGTVNDSPCCNTILGILGDACNVPCIGENGSISEVLCEILDTVTSIDISGVFTVLVDIKDTLTECCAEIKADLNGVFTVLADIKDTLTECCAEIHADFEATWTILADIKTDIFDTQTLIIDGFEGTWTILADIKDTLTECCSEIKADFNGVFTVLADIKTDIFDTQTLIIDDFEGTWTILADLKDTLTECCSEIKADFNGVFTVLADIKTDIFDTQTLIIDGFEGTWTILANLDLNCSTTVEIDLNGVFTVLANLDLSCTAEVDLSGIYTVLANLDLSCTAEVDLSGVYTVLANLDLSCTAEVDLSGVYTVLADIKTDIFNTQTLIIDGFEGTWTILANLDLNCSTTVEIDLNGVFTVLANLDLSCTAEVDLSGIYTVLANLDLSCTAEVDLSGVYTVLANLEVSATVDLSGVYTVLEDCCACGPIPLFQSDVDGAGQIQLTMTGLSYCLAENITGTIVITASDVTVNGEEHILTGRVVIDAPNTILYNAKIKPQSPVNDTDAGNAAVEISATGTNTQILNCLIECAASTGATTGRGGIESSGEKTSIKGCNVISGSADSGLGGRGIVILGSNSLIEDTIVQGGSSISSISFHVILVGDNVILSINNVTAIGGDNPAALGTPVIKADFPGAFTSIRNSNIIGGTNRRGIIIADGLIDNTTVIAGAGTMGSTEGILISSSNKFSVTNSRVIAGNFPTGTGGIGIRIDSSKNIVIDTVEIQAGSGIIGGAGIFFNLSSYVSIINSNIVAGNGSSGAGGQGISIQQSSHVTIDTVSVQGGSGTTGGVSVNSGSSYVSIVNSNVTAGNSLSAGFAGAHGIQMFGSNGLIDNVTVTASNGVAGSSGSGGAGGSAIIVAGNNTIIKNSTATAGNGGAGDVGAGNGGIGGDGITISVSNVSVSDTVVKGGNGGGSTFGSTNAGAGGNGIAISASNITVEGLIATGGAGGVGDPGGLGITGGNGGDGIRIIVNSSDIKTVIVKACTIVDGGVGGASAGAGGTPGNGGHGIFVSSSLSFIVSDIQISDCTINNVGQAAAPGIGGDGIRIDSGDTDNPSECIQVINTQVIGSGGNGLYIIAGSNIEVKECSASCNGIDGFVIDNGGGIIFDSLNSLHNLSAGIHTGGNSFDIQIKDCKAEANGTDGILVEAAATQVISCCATSNTSFGINNLGGTVATYYNNVATNNLGGNYSGVSLVRVPGPQTGFYTNVAQGQQDCDLCDLFTVIADISDTQTLLMAGFEGTWTILGDCCACGPIPLFQSDVVGGAITLSTTGMNYCLAENITGNIIVTGGNITLEGNDRVLTGRIRIDAADPIVKNIKVKPAAPADNTEAAFAAIDITSNGANAQILHCLIVCASSTVSGVVGRSGIITAATKTWVKDCNITAGAAATVTAGAATTAVGGSGIVISGSFGLISDSLAIAGAGSTNNVIASLGGAGGIGVQISGANGLILNSKFTGGNGGSAGPSPNPGNSTGGAGGRGGDVTGADIQVADSEFTGGSGGVISSGIGTTTGGFGGVGFSMASLNGQFLNSNATGGLGGNSASNTSAGGAGGAAFGIGTDNVEVRNSTLIGASGGTGVTGGAGGQGVGIGANNIMMADTKLIAGSGANGTATGGGSGFGITAQSCNRVTFLNLIVIGGNGGVGGTGLGGTALSSIDILGCNVVLVKACNIIDGSNGGNGGTTGGNGGSGILVRGNSVDVQISECRVERVGAAGTGGAPTPGNGIDISSATNVQVTSNYVSGCPGNGIRTAGGTNHQVMSNRVSACTLFAFLNSVGTQAVFGNNAATNTGANYSGVTVRTPVSLDAGTAPTYWDNIFYLIA